MDNHRIILIGASAGGRLAVEKVLQNVSADINAAFLVVVHSSFDMISSFSKYLNQKIEMEVMEAQENMAIEKGKVYLGIPNQHMVVVNGKISNSNGPRENLFRPSIDVLFRSAAVAFGNRSIGILLSGRLNDGTVGLEAIKKCGGVAMIQEPETAEYSGMPLTAQKFVEIDYSANLEEIGDIIKELTDKPLPEKKEIPYTLVRESEIATKIRSQVKTEDLLGEKVSLSCASCGGPLWKIKDTEIERYRCHVGHSFSQESLLLAQNENLEQTLWVCLRTLEEKKVLMLKIAENFKSKGSEQLARSYSDRIQEVDEHIDRLRQLMDIRD
ncbi:chemotaxis protein CheB [Christiangramia sediminis]|uniref:protein-glutamate methylesterase n=1 Tax=Christiangramia sediminis TaxID=2881336 RepID=A0A9X1RW66_9FLAO|nr:chemotaxis protein CheB [Christiangramia sediminis]MCB7480142.1 chemotaxis protein CheB [Christiangramia sediminis]